MNIPETLHTLKLPTYIEMRKIHLCGRGAEMEQPTFRPSFIIFMTIIVFLAVFLGYLIYTNFIDASLYY